MNDDSQFENRLRDQQVKPVPGEWRNDILAEAKRAASIHPKLPSRSRFAFEDLKRQIILLLWPAPKAWAGLAAVWVTILVMNLSASDDTANVASAQSRPSPETLQALQQQRLLLAELVDRTETHPINRPKSLTPGPRSQRREESATV